MTTYQTFAAVAQTLGIYAAIFLVGLAICCWGVWRWSRDSEANR